MDCGQTKECVRCKETKSCSEFYRCKSYRDGLDYWCKVCRKRANEDNLARIKADPDRKAKWTAKNIEYAKRRRARKAANPELFADETERNRRIAREHYWQNREEYINRARAREIKLRGGGGSHSCEAWRQLKELFGNKCLCCGKETRMTKDHVVPVVSGGTDDIENLQPLCKRCNKAKFTQTIDYRTRDKVVLAELNDVGRLIFGEETQKPVAVLRKHKGSSRFTGVAKVGNRWRAYIGVGGKLKHLGRHDTEEAAALAYNAASRELFGESAFVNEVGPHAQAC